MSRVLSLVPYLVQQKNFETILHICLVYYENNFLSKNAACLILTHLLKIEVWSQERQKSSEKNKKQIENLLLECHLSSHICSFSTNLVLNLETYKECKVFKGLIPVLESET